MGERRPLRHLSDMPSTGVPHVRPKFGAQWEPHVVEQGAFAEAVSGPVAHQTADEATLLAGWRLDPAVWRIIDGTLQVNRWQQHDGSDDWLYQFKARLERCDGGGVSVDTARLFKRIRQRRPAARPAPTGDLTFLVCVGDTQIGKGDGDGSEGTVRRWRNSLDGTVDRLKVLRRSYRIGTVCIAFMGDLREGCTGNYPAQKFTTDLSVTQQLAVLEELTFETIGMFAPLTERLIVAAVPGNHGEERDQGKAYTIPSDNHDVKVIQTAQRGIRLNANHAFDHVEWLYPAGHGLTVAVDLSGVPVGFAHGHQFQRGSSPAAKAEAWWQRQAHAKTAIGDCDVLISGHYHHLLVSAAGRKTHIQTPALDGGSTWWANLTGQVSAPGMLSLIVGDGAGPAACGWDELRVI